MRGALLLLVLVRVSALSEAAPLGATPLEPGLVGRSDIIFFESFESATWYQHWKLTSAPQNTSVGQVGFKGQGLKVAVPQGQHYGTSFGFDFAKFNLAEPEELFFRYYLRFDTTWDGGSGGKLPGFGGTYGVAGWGGQPSHGDDGWSARGTFKGAGTGQTQIGYYVYHADMTGTYGNSWMWTLNSNAGLLKHDQWYCVEGYVKLNTPGQNNGILRGWVDGTLAYEKTDLNFRTVTKLKVERYWFNIYYGGDWTPAQDMALFADNVVVASGKVGCYTVPQPDSGPPAPDSSVPALDTGVTAADSSVPTSDTSVTSPDNGQINDFGAASAADSPGTGGSDEPASTRLEGGSGCSCGMGSDRSTWESELLLLLILLLGGRVHPRRPRGRSNARLFKDTL